MKEHHETQRNVSPSEQEEDERRPMPTFAIKDLFKKLEAVRAMVLEWHPNQADVSRGVPNAVYKLGGEAKNILRSHMYTGKHGQKHDPNEVERHKDRMATRQNVV
ncbi:hypothetical protein TNCV_1194811 [Trichonephila clavipes]|nr:hypothetical protein TNCV_1194811 [Trichonephila clavipes]